ncbi:hypothetical protein [Gordonia sp. (in: high G+C Gram-positive bacteria)]|uniref:hypothetical protein n=1 Tax=Gordonia sp. (in: high G+C Gram-positive bacteria) TaxID=84139 RepID=UPI0039E606BA
MTPNHPQPAPYPDPQFVPGAFPPPPPPRRGRAGLLVALAVAAVAIVALIAVLAVVLLRGGKESTAQDRTTVVEGQTTTVSVPAAADAQNLPAGAVPCPRVPGLATHEGRKTSCEFAVSVRDAYISAGPRGESRVVNGWAPTQHASVPMTCGPLDGSASVIVCRGGTQSIVYLY